MNRTSIILTAIALLAAPFALSAEKKGEPAKTPAKKEAKPTPAKGASKADEKAMNLPFKGTVEAITSRTLTLKAGEGKEPRKYTVNKSTVIVKGEAAATTEDVKPGQEVSGSFARTESGDTLTKLQLKPPTPAKKTPTKATK